MPDVWDHRVGRLPKLAHERSHSAVTSAGPELNAARECGTGAAADLLGRCAGQTVRNLIERGEIAARQERRGSRFVWRVDRDSVDDYQRRAGNSARTTPDAWLAEQIAALEQRLDILEAQSRVGAREAALLEEVVAQVRRTARQHQHALDLLRDAFARRLRPQIGDGDQEAKLTPGERTE